MDEIEKFRVLTRLKNTYRITSVGHRKESTAEHTWSTLVLADFLLSKVTTKLDKLRVFELLMYHDVVEIEAGDTALRPGKHAGDQLGKKDRERRAAERLREKLPPEIAHTFMERFEEFEERTTPEAQFAKAIDHLDAVINQMDHPEDWGGWTRAFYVEKKRPYFEPFPELLKFFDELMDHLEKEGYFDQ